VKKSKCVGLVQEIGFSTPNLLQGDMKQFKQMGVIL
jgi:hypothetical protein